MTVSISKLTSGHNVKTIVGKLLQDGFSHVTVVVTDKNGSQSIKRFDKSKYTIRFV